MIAGHARVGCCHGVLVVRVRLTVTGLFLDTEARSGRRRAPAPASPAHARAAGAERRDAPCQRSAHCTRRYPPVRHPARERPGSAPPPARSMRPQRAGSALMALPERPGGTGAPAARTDGPPPYRRAPPARPGRPAGCRCAPGHSCMGLVSTVPASSSRSLRQRGGLAIGVERPATRLEIARLRANRVQARKVGPHLFQHGAGHRPVERRQERRRAPGVMQRRERAHQRRTRAYAVGQLARVGDRGKCPAPVLAKQGKIETRGCSAASWCFRWRDGMAEYDGARLSVGRARPCPAQGRIPPRDRTGCVPRRPNPAGTQPSSPGELALATESKQSTARATAAGVRRISSRACRSSPCEQEFLTYGPFPLYNRSGGLNGAAAGAPGAHRIPRAPRRGRCQFLATPGVAQRTECCPWLAPPRGLRSGRRSSGATGARERCWCWPRAWCSAPGKAGRVSDPPRLLLFMKGGSP